MKTFKRMMEAYDTGYDETESSQGTLVGPKSSPHPRELTTRAQEKASTEEVEESGDKLNTTDSAKESVAA